MVLNDIVEIVNGYSNIYLAGHINPDGDCVGATIAMALSLKKLGVDTKILLKEVGTKYDYLPIDEYVTDVKPEKIDVLITLDCGDSDRLGEFEACCNEAKEVINIDHHISNTKYGNYNLVAEASSTCEVIYDMIEDKSFIDRELAIALYTGIIYDTGGFKHSNTTKHTLNVAADLISYEFDFTEIMNKLFYYKSIKGLQATSRATDNIRFFKDNRIAVSYISIEDQKALDINKQHTGSIVQILKEIEGVECSVFIYQLSSNSSKLSLRSTGAVNVCEIAKKFNGGGHIKASGCTIENDLEHIIEAVVKEIELQM